MAVVLSTINVSNNWLIFGNFGYTREAGLRNLDCEIAAICRDVASIIAEKFGTQNSNLLCQLCAFRRK
ncbi:MAG: hypothetical protein K8R86_11990 [Bacteroidales bacterium]|nr:hypothetical protein [Bacteroidales bacterium]